jgi:hypothetical protein
VYEIYLRKGYCARGGTCKCLWLGDNGVTLPMVKRSYQNFNSLLGQESNN